ncbi:single-stranded DNA-binding protein [Nocardioides sp. zg-536]|uniref:Single-stranded DNA-binding protein n=1 Tax=Nocardioides faecalis TaxID=2803858 RepID=A0A939BZ73_9ACTN|nr:single-stranded DNA-binding protein [Nocardioides faecalis]MBM9460735.1 single-stranded DNA-binding protein [Nocardioides faecalis]MBS4752674.1 single-stranded DNA-binding protein [Nocardioides faecalis]QVI57936.1 single-stranded DNA-binding protein [Nocardioides faecalis]
MANETTVTVQGWIGTVPVVRDVAGTTVLNFRLGCTPRHYNRTAGEWVDGETQWYGVSAWRRLAAHGAKSLKQGDPVLVHGRLNHRTYVNKNGVEAVSIEIEAVTIGHDLTRGVATFLKAPPAEATAPAREETSPAADAWSVPGDAAGAQDPAAPGLSATPAA